MNAQWALFQKAASTSLTLIHVSAAAPALALARTTLSSKTKFSMKLKCIKKEKSLPKNRLFSFFLHFL
jgi:hypothetical protein